MTHRSQLIALCFLLAAGAAAQDHLIQPTDLFHLKELKDVAVSPDGATVVYAVHEIVADPEAADRHAYRTNLWMTAIDGSRPPRQLTAGHDGASSPVWHPGGHTLAFVRPVDGRPQVHLLRLDGGEAVPVTSLARGATDPRFSPDGSALLVASTLPLDELGVAAPPPWPSERPARQADDTRGQEADPAGSDEAVRAFLDRQPEEIVEVTTRLDFQGEHDLDPTPEFRHLYVVPVANLVPGAMPAARPLTRGYVSYEGGRWTPDGAFVVASIPADTTAHPDRVLQSRLVRIPSEGGAPEPLLVLDGWSLRLPEPAPDGRAVAFLAGRLDQLGFQENHVGVLDLGSGEVAWPAEALDRSVSDVRFGRDGRGLYLVAPTDGAFPLFRVGLDDASLTRLTDLRSGVRSFDVGPAGLAFVLTRVENPYELFAALPGNADHRQLSRHNADWLAERRLSHPDHRTLTRIMQRPGAPPDTLEMDYWVMEPVDPQPGERYPVLLQIHGGPSAMWGPGEATMWHEFQMFTARGIGVVYANPRGSGGYGFNFRYANYQDWGTGPAGDVLAALDAALDAEDWADPRRQLITGGSYAGYLTAWIIAHTDRFSAAVAQRGVYDLRTFLGEGNAWRLLPYHFGGYPWDDYVAPILEANSPITFVENITTPLLIKHASQDLRTGVSQSEQLYRSLKILGRPVEYVRYPGGGHDLSRTGDPDQRLDRLLRSYEFLARHVE